ncbi:MAG: hypothetical protein Q9P14_04635 [candidate division KSB1 bacterium]|nr:hypothetical protein [candidate division KSB1 bacterium]
MKRMEPKMQNFALNHQDWLTLLKLVVNWRKGISVDFIVSPSAILLAGRLFTAQDES